MDLRYHLQDIGEAADRFWQAYPAEKVFAFHGEMGAGKTTFIHALCVARRVSDVVGSPTFSIINEYRLEGGERGDGYRYGEGGGRLFHIDLYRLKDEEEALRAGVEDVLFSGDICLVEWPDRAPGIFPPETVHIDISMIDQGMRKITSRGRFP